MLSGLLARDLVLVSISGRKRGLKAHFSIQVTFIGSGLPPEEGATFIKITSLI